MIKKKIVLPFIVWIGLIAINIVTIVNGIAKHDMLRISIAAVALIILSTILFFVIKQFLNQTKQA